MTFEEQVALANSTKHVHHKWYKSNYPDVALLKMDPCAHYVLYGADMGRNPGRSFNTKFYLETYPDAVASGMNPLVHYALHGQGLGYATRPSWRSAGVKQVGLLRTKLLSLGLTDRAVAELEVLLQNAPDAEARIMAAQELGLWNMRLKVTEGYQIAIDYLKSARAEVPALNVRRKLAVAELMCHHFLSDLEAAHACYERAALAGEISDDLILASANLEQSIEERINRINRVLVGSGIPEVKLTDNFSLSPYDRLTSAVALPKVDGGPKVTVLIAAYEASETLPTALRSLQQQTWQNLEIIVLDDCSPNPDTISVAEEFAVRDPRIRVIKMEENGGAYIARNRGLDEATGEYVTLHDADDWSHPKKIETQVRFMEENPQIMGCTSQQARTTPELTFPRWAGASASIGITRHNMSSFMVRHHPVFEAVGYWDAVRFGADSEKIQRVRTAFGNDSVAFIETGLLSFQRISESSIASSDSFGYEGFFFGARREYLQAQQDHRKKTFCYSNPKQPNFGVPRVMHPLRSKQTTHFDVIIASEFRMKGGSTRSNIEEILCQAKAGLRTGLVQMYRYDCPDRGIIPEVRELIDSGLCTVITHGESVSCDLLTVRYPPVLDNVHRYLPKIDAKTVNVIINQPPMSDYGPDGIRRYYLENCAKNARHHFGKNATWYPIGPLVRDALHEHHHSELSHINLSPNDWCNIINVEDWDRGQHKLTGKLRIGRHSRDHEHKWPTDKEDILSAYPNADDVEVHILGGSQAAASIINEVPNNWTVHEFGSLHPREFLRDIDVWIYFSNPGWVESFGRAIIEAMAVGVPVILPEVYRSLFKDAVLYATPKTALSLARKLHSDPEAYYAQVKKAQEYVRENFGYEMHINRIRKAIIEGGFQAASQTASIDAELPKIPKIPKIPSKSGKTAYAELMDLPQLDLSAGDCPTVQQASLLRCHSKGHRFDFLWSPKADAKRLFVIFSGDARRNKISPPVFQRWKWAPHFIGHCLYVSDPMLHMHPDMGLAWYAGTVDCDPLKEIILRVKALLTSLGLKDQDVCAYGSSGGGFAALRMAAIWPGISVVSINPQTNIANFKWASPDLYAQVCLNRPDRHAALSDFPERMDLVHQVDKLRNRRIVLVQNTLDSHHFEKHYKPFCSAMGVPYEANLNTGNFRRILFSHEGGHAKAETPEVFATAMSIVQRNFASSNLLEIA
ncbi:glycosyltransferase [Paracoccus fontiphilus]|uniref:Glycosyltransferase n=1 Tax=Paracoccus fontiphilus TaxID=1815556 RepID=A0ABV7ILJ8_9RHOB|nr:glycosyltransferase [Paracoccus fontiphilus]